MLERLPELVNTNPALVRRGQWTNADMLIGIGEARWMVRIRAGRVDECAPVPIRVAPCDFALLGTEEAWAEFWKPMPKPRHHDLIALIREGKMRFEGNLDMLMGNLLYLKMILETPRGLVP